MHPRQLLSAMSGPRFGEDETDYFRRQVDERCTQSGASMSLMELREACRLRYLQMEVVGLLEKLNTEQSPEAMRRAVTLLLKEVFFL